MEPSIHHLLPDSKSFDETSLAMKQSIASSFFLTFSEIFRTEKQATRSTTIYRKKYMSLLLIVMLEIHPQIIKNILSSKLDSFFTAKSVI